MAISNSSHSLHVLAFAALYTVVVCLFPELSVSAPLELLVFMLCKVSTSHSTREGHYAANKQYLRNHMKSYMKAYAFLINVYHFA